MRKVVILCIALFFSTAAYADNKILLEVSAVAPQGGMVELAWDAGAPVSGVTVARYLVGIRTDTTPEVLSDAGLVLGFTYTSLNGGVKYYFKVYAQSTEGAKSGPSNEVNITLAVGTPDTTPPSAPTNLIGSGASMVQINLSWTASTDNIAIAGYSVYRNGNKVSDVNSTTFSDVALTPATTYSYTVKAKDTSANMSPDSNLALVATLGDTTSPSTPGAPRAVVTTTSVALSWDEATDNVGVAGYKILRGGVQIGVTSTLGYTDNNLTPNTSYSYNIVAFDLAGNNSTPAVLAAQTQALPTPCVANGKPYTITISVSSYTKTVKQGGRGEVFYRLINSVPVTMVQIKLGTQVTGEILGSELRGVLGSEFIVPAVPGSFNLFLTARDSAGCVTTTTLPRLVNVQ